MNGNNDFPGVDGDALRQPPTKQDPHERMLTYGSVVQWYSQCGYWGGYHRIGHTGKNAVGANSGQFAGAGSGVNNGSCKDNIDDDKPVGMHTIEAPEVPSETFSRLSLVDLI